MKLSRLVSNSVTGISVTVSFRTKPLMYWMKSVHVFISKISMFQNTLKNWKPKLKKLKRKKIKRSKASNMKKQRIYGTMNQNWSENWRKRKKTGKKNPKQKNIPVTEDDIAEVVAMMTGIPVKRVAQSESKKLVGMND